MLKFVAPSESIVSAVRDDILKRKTQDEDPTDLAIVSCSDGLVVTSKNLLCIYSHLLRAIIGHQNTDTAYISLQTFTKNAVENALKVLEMNWEQSVVFDTGVMKVFETLNIRIGDVTIVTKKVDDEKIDNYHDVLKPIDDMEKENYTGKTKAKLLK